MLPQCCATAGTCAAKARGLGEVAIRSIFASRCSNCYIVPDPNVTAGCAKRFRSRAGVHHPHPPEWRRFERFPPEGSPEAPRSSASCLTTGPWLIRISISRQGRARPDHYQLPAIMKSPGACPTLRRLYIRILASSVVVEPRRIRVGPRPVGFFVRISAKACPTGGCFAEARAGFCRQKRCGKPYYGKELGA